MKKFFFFLSLLSTVFTYADHVRRFPFCPSVKKVSSVLKKYLPSNCTIIEAGGYDGKDTLKLHKAFPNAQIHVFEPVPELYELITNKTSSIPSIHTYQLALGNFNGIGQFYISFDGNTLSTASSLLPPTKSFEDYHPGSSFPSQLEVTVSTLDQWASSQNIDHIDFMWLDMQGHEFDMLKSSELAKSSSSIFLEINFVEVYENQGHFEEINAWMNSNDFILIGADFDPSQPLGPKKHAKGIYYGNALYLKKSLLNDL